MIWCVATPTKAQLRQKLKYDRALQAKAYEPGDLIWVLCRYVPKNVPQKLMRAWRGPHRFAHVLQDGRVYILDTGQKVHLERLKPHQSGPSHFATTPMDTSQILERSVASMNDDLSQNSYKSEQLHSEASNVSLPSRRRHCRGSRLHYQQFDCSTSNTDDELSDAMLPTPTYPQDLEQPAMPPEPLPEHAAQDPVSNVSFQGCLPRLFSDHEPARSPSPQLSLSDNPTAQSLVGMSAPLLTNPLLIA